MWKCLKKIKTAPQYRKYDNCEINFPMSVIKARHINPAEIFSDSNYYFFFNTCNNLIMHAIHTDTEVLCRHFLLLLSNVEVDNENTDF